MLNKPQNRKDFVEPFLTGLNITRYEFLFTSGYDGNFLAIASANSDEALETLCKIVFASDNSRPT